MLTKQDVLIEKEFKESYAYNMAHSDALLLEEKRTDISKEITKIHETRESLRAEEKAATSDDSGIKSKITEATKKLSELHRTLDNIKNTKDRGIQVLDKAKRDIRARIISEADVVYVLFRRCLRDHSLCTLSGAGHDSLSDIKDVKFPMVSGWL